MNIGVMGCGIIIIIYVIGRMLKYVKMDSQAE